VLPRGAGRGLHRGLGTAAGHVETGYRGWLVTTGVGGDMKESESKHKSQAREKTAASVL